MKVLRYSLLSAVLLLSVGQTSADTYTGRDFFNDLLKPGKRQGLVGRFDFAGGVVHTTAEHSSWTPREWVSDDGGAGVVFGVGYGITDQILISGSVRGLIYGEYALLGLFTGPFALLFADEHLAATAGLSYYLGNSQPSWFLEAGVASGSMGNPFDDTIVYKTSSSGPGFYAGVGYEFAKHYQLELHLLWNQNRDADYDKEGRWTATSVFLTFGVLGY
jgi:hypothetical protein